jgi:hypothetical protein
VITRAQLTGGERDHDVESVGDVTLSLVHAETDAATGLRVGVVQLETVARLRIGAFAAGVSVTRRLRVRKRFYVTRGELAFLAADVSREVLRQ